MKIDIKKYSADYLNDIIKNFSLIDVTLLPGNTKTFNEGIEDSVNLILDRSAHGSKIIFIGNGASQAISSHFSADFLKNGEIKTMAITDPSLLTCMGNDYGYEHVFEKPIEIMADKGDILIAISSSGQSENILKACDAARNKECYIITLSGFKENNPLKSRGDVNFYVPSGEYGIVENIHHTIVHCMIDAIIEIKQN